MFMKKFVVRALFAVPAGMAAHYLVDRPVNEQVKKGNIDPMLAFVGTLALGIAAGTVVRHVADRVSR
jgi:hypothetical protein